MAVYVANRGNLAAHEQIASDLRHVGAYLVAHADELTGGGSELIGEDSLKVEIVLGPCAVPRIRASRDVLVIERPPSARR